MKARLSRTHTRAATAHPHECSNPSPLQLAALRKSPDAAKVAIAKKLNHQLARAALAKQLEASGEVLSEIERQERLVELRLAQEEQVCGAQRRHLEPASKPLRALLEASSKLPRALLEPSSSLP